MILACHHISKSFVEKPVLNDITFHLEKGDRAAIVGINGEGKSTLLKIIIGQESADEGTVAFARDVTFGYLAQNQNLSTDHTILEEMQEVKKDVLELGKRIEEDEKKMETLTGDALNEVVTEYNELLRKYQLENGYACKGEITGVLRGLGFTEEDFEQKISTLSGGQKTRVALAKILLEKPDIIILDEPTNHLDIGSIQWLETFLMNYRGTVLVVSHDRYFLDRTVTKIIEIENTKATLFTGNYSAYAEQKKAQREATWHNYLNNQAQIKHQEEVIAKLRQFNREKSIKRAESREKMLGKMEKVEKPIEMKDDMHLVLRPCIRSGQDVMTVHHLTKRFDQKELFTDAEFSIRRGEHVAIIGNNGTGKSTLLKIIMDQESADDGTIRFGTNVHLGYYDQEHHVLNDENTLFEEIGEAHPDMTNTEIRNLLASFLFTGDDVFKRIGDLSGGEKGRVSLAKLMLSEANFLILDEPTNHLDLVSKEVLENALNSYEGTVLYVSHDRYFINHTATRILSLTHRVILDYPGNNEEGPERFTGNYDFYLQKSAEVEQSLLSAEVKRIREDLPDYENDEIGNLLAPKDGSPERNPQESAAESGKADWQKQKEEQAKARKLATDLKKCEEKISELEDENQAIDAKMVLPENATNVAELSKLQKKKEANEAELADLYEKWEMLQS